MMKTLLYYYSGTGNSLWSARLLAAELGDAELVFMPRTLRQEWKPVSAKVTGYIFPVHMWGLPRAVIQCVKKTACNPESYYFALGVNAGQVSRTLVQLQKLMRRRGVDLSSAFDIVLPSNYIPWGGPGPAEEQRQLFKQARNKIKNLSGIIQRREKQAPEMGPWWQRILFTGLYHLAFPHVPAMDKSFWVDEKCNGCSICSRVCPAGNIAMQSQKPVWGGRCDQCLACIQWCPEQAIQYGRKTPAYARYHHPEITLSDLLAAAAHD